MKNLVLCCAFLVGCWGSGYPPYEITETGSYNFVTTDLIIQSRTNFPYSADELACLTYFSFRSFADQIPEHDRLEHIQEIFSFSMIYIVDEEVFKKQCQVPSTQAVACINFFGQSRDPYFWVPVVRSAHFDRYADTPGEPMIHEFVHALSREATQYYDYRHSSPVFWAAQNDKSIQSMIQQNFQRYCLTPRDN